MSALKNNQGKQTGMDAGELFDMSSTDGLEKVLFNPVQMSVALVEFLGTTIFNILRCSCVLGELLIRRNFGIRYFNLYLYFGGAMWFWAFASGIINLPKLFGIHTAPLISNGAVFGVLGFLFFGMMFYHLVVKKFMPLNLDQYGYYDGDLLPFLYKLPYAKDKQGNPKEYLIRQVFEPALIMLSGWVVALTLNPQTGSFLIITSLGFALKEYVRSQKVRNLILDQVDADIIARNMKGVLSGKTTKNTQGLYIAGLPNDGKLKQKLVETINNKAEPFTAQ